MRLIPMLTALVVTATLIIVVFERDALVAFARGETATEATEAENASAETVAQAAAQEAAPAAASKAVKVVVQTSVAQTIDGAVLMRGETQADRQVEVRSETTARVISEPLRKGSFVETGDMLCQLDTGTRESTLAEAKARLKEAEARVPEAQARLDEAFASRDEAEINFNAASKLSQGGFASETRLAETKARVSSASASIEAAKAGLETAQAGIESAEAAVHAAEQEIDRLTIVAPFSGLLETDTAELGSLMQPGSLCATVIRLNPIKVVGYVPETEVARVNVGALAGAELATGQEVGGIVTFLSRSADPTTRTFLVEISVGNDDLSIRDGQTAEILIAGEGSKAHRLPQSALTLNNEGRLGVRIVGDGNIVRFRDVTLVRDDADGIWLTGLPDEADVIVVGQDFVTDGVLVEATYREAQQ